jgi:hypothetical protein
MTFNIKGSSRKILIISSNTKRNDRVSHSGALTIIIQAPGVDVIRINFTAPSCDANSIASFVIRHSSFVIRHLSFFILHSSYFTFSTFVMLFSVESISSTSSMIIINASLKILIFLLGILAWYHCW